MYLSMARLLFILVSITAIGGLFLCYILHKQTFDVLRLKVACCHHDDTNESRIRFGTSVIISSDPESPNSIINAPSNQKAVSNQKISYVTRPASGTSAPEDIRDIGKSPDYFNEQGFPRSCEGNPECLALRELFSSSRWPKNKPKAVIYFLTQLKRLHVLQETLWKLDLHFNAVHRYPIIIFHERDFRTWRRSIRNITKSDVYFQTVNFRIPTFLKKKIVFDIPCLSHVSYRHMCRFQAKTMYDYPIIDGLEYTWRLDDDSEISSDVTYDVFKYMQMGGYLYGYRLIHVDALSCTDGLWEATEKFIVQYNITPTFFKEWPRPRIYYNNFEISSMKLWRSESYGRYINYIDSLGGIYYHRWGDAPIKSIAVSLFVPADKVYAFKDIAYKHQSVVVAPNVTSILTGLSTEVL